MHHIFNGIKRLIQTIIDFQVLLEPYSKAYYYSEERISTRYADHPIEANCKFSDMKAICEAPYKGEDEINVFNQGLWFNISW